jgi:hypothetical protein
MGLPSIGDFTEQTFGVYNFSSFFKYTADESEDWGFDPPSRAIDDCGISSPYDGYSFQWPDFEIIHEGGCNADT